MTNSIADIVDADVLLVTGSNTTEAHPVLSLQMKKAVRQRGAKLILIDPRQIELADFAALHLRQQPGTDIAIFNAMAHVIIGERLANEAFIAERTEGFEALAAAVADWPPERAAAISGVPAEQIIAAARLYAQANNGAIFWAMGITQHTTGTDNVKALSNLALLTGHVGRPRLPARRRRRSARQVCDRLGRTHLQTKRHPWTDRNRNHGRRIKRLHPRHFCDGRKPYALRPQLKSRARGAG
jgi:predicted molibdopterin-dependent oxidoreductase YjgC